MAIIIQGSRVAGVGKPGLSAYDLAKKGGYTGTEAEFSRELNAATSFDDYLESHNLDLNAHPDIQALIDENTDALETVAASKSDKGHTHTKSEITDFPTSLPASDVSAWAKATSKPSYTASEVGADPVGTASSIVSTHNTATDAHNDIRDLITNLITRLNTLADSDDTTLDQLSEIVTYIKSNKSLIDGVTTGKVNVADIIDNLTTNATDKPLSAAQGVALKVLIDAIVVPTTASEVGAISYQETQSLSDEQKAQVKANIGIEETSGNNSITYGTEDLEAGVSTLETGTLYLVYE